MFWLINYDCTEPTLCWCNRWYQVQMGFLCCTKSLTIQELFDSIHTAKLLLFGLFESMVYTSGIFKVYQLMHHVLKQLFLFLKSLWFLGYKKVQQMSFLVIHAVKTIEWSLWVLSLRLFYPRWINMRRGHWLFVLN